MPYIKQELRPKYAESIVSLVKHINAYTEAKDKINAFALFVEMFVVRIGKFSYMPLSFASVLSNEQREFIRKEIDLLATQFNIYDPYSEAGNMNYVISSVWWGISGSFKDTPSANYAFRCITRGCVEQILANLPTQAGVPSPTASTYRCSMQDIVTMRGVLNDVITEIYRRLTSDYENAKTFENGDIWIAGELSLPIGREVF